MGTASADVVICGAGIAGIAAAYHLAVRQGIGEVWLVDERAPLSLTSDKSTEAYRNWWPGPDDAMVRLMNRSIDLLEEIARATGNRIRLNRRGYVYATADPTQAAALRAAGERAAELGAGALRVHDGGPDESPYRPAPADGFEGLPEGADLILGGQLRRRWFPYLPEHTEAVLHARRCGWFSGQQLGMHLLEQGRRHGVRFVDGRVVGVTVGGGRVRGVRIDGNTTSRQVETEVFVNAAGPLLRPVGRMLGVDLPVHSELHRKVTFPDARGVVPRDAPLLIWQDPQQLLWSEEERELFATDEATRWLLDTFPPGVHLRPEGGSGSVNLLMLWDYHKAPVPEAFPLPPDPDFPEIVLRGMSTMVPALGGYLEHLPKTHVDGGYYTKTRENRLLCGPLPVRGGFVLGALSGYGLMAAAAAGELLAAHVAGSELPAYGAAFAPARYDDPGYRRRLETWEDSGQL